MLINKFISNRTHFLQNSVYLLLIVFFFLGCSQKVQIKAIKSAKITNGSIKNIGVVAFENDSISQSVQINSAISNIKINNEKYFNLIDKKNIDLVLKEQKLNDSGLVNLKGNTIQTGLSQVETLVVGEVLINDKSISFFREQRTNYRICIKSYKKKGKTYCERYRNYKVHCQTNKYTVKTKINLINTKNAEILFTDTYEASSKYRHCSDDYNILPTKTIENTKLAKIIANKLLKDIAPSYVYFTLTLLDELNIDVNDKQDLLFENALKMIEHKRILKANQMLKTLNTQVNSKSYAVLYNLAITEELLGDINQAYSFLKQAENIALETDNIVDEIVIYMKKMQDNLSEKIKANKQIKEEI